MKSPVRPRRALSFFVLIACLLLTFGASRFVRWSLDGQARLKFENQTKDMHFRIKERLDIYINALHGAQGLFAANPEGVGRRQWAAYFRKQELGRRFPGILAVEFVEKVKNKDRDEFIKRVRSDKVLAKRGYPRFRIHPEGERDEYYVVNYIEPYQNNERDFGFDTGSEMTRRIALEKSRDTGLPIISSRIDLLQDSGYLRSGFLIFLPVYQSGPTPQTVEERRETIQGFVLAVVRAPQLFNEIFGPATPRPNIHFQVFDGLLLTDEHLLYEDQAPLREKRIQPRFQEEAVLPIAGRAFVLRFMAGQDFGLEGSAERRLVIGFLGGGLLISFLVAGIFYSLSMSRARAVGLARQMTDHLRQEINQRKEVEIKLRNTIEELEVSRKRLQEANDKLREADLVKTRFISAASHELRTPLTSIKGFVALLLREKDALLSPRYREYLRVVKIGADRLHRMVNDLLDLSKIEAGKHQMEKQWIHPSEWLEEECLLFKAQADQKKIQLDLRVENKHLPKIYGDPDKLKQALGNLINNALKYTGPGGRVTVLAEAAPEKLSISVEDTGIGISEDDQARIFEPFYTVHHKAIESAESTGLGLSLVKAIAEAHGGTISVKSSVGKGSRFTFLLPVKSIPSERPLHAGSLL